LYRYIKATLILPKGYKKMEERVLYAVGRCALTTPDPQLKGAWYPGGFNPCTYQVKNRFQNVPFKWVNSHRYNADGRKVTPSTMVGRCTLNQVDP
jgi:hypothetical protein